MIVTVRRSARCCDPDEAENLVLTVTQVNCTPEPPSPYSVLIHIQASERRAPKHSHSDFSSVH